MGLHERFLTAGVGVPLALWAILYDARLCLSLILVLQAICVQELYELLRRTRAGRQIAATRVGVGFLGGPLLLHTIADAVGLAAAFGGRGAPGVALSVGMALLVARRLGLMRDHWAALKPDDTPLSADAYRRTLGGMLDTRIGQAEARERVVECGIFLLGLEVSAMLWLVGGWSSLVALRFRGSTGAADVVFLLAVVFNSDNGGLLAGSIFKYLRSKQHGDVQSQQPQQPQKRSSAGLPPKTVAATGSSTPGLLAVASPNKTWVGVTGAIILGTATALVLEGLACRLSASEPVQDCFSVSALNRDLLCATGVVICAVGIVGDLWESLLKRAAMVKDSGMIFPGHGGCLDRLDGVLAAAPLYLAVVELCREVAVDS